MQQFLISLSYLLYFPVAAQYQPGNLINACPDTLRLNLTQAEELFARNNLILLLQQPDVATANQGPLSFCYLFLNTFIHKPEDTSQKILPHFF